MLSTLYNTVKHNYNKTTINGAYSKILSNIELHKHLIPKRFGGVPEVLFNRNYVKFPQFQEILLRKNYHISPTSYDQFKEKDTKKGNVIVDHRSLLCSFLFATLIGLLYTSTATASEKQEYQEDETQETNQLLLDYIRTEDAVVTYAPVVPPPITRDYPVKLRLKMNTEIVKLPVDEVYSYEFWSFNGKVPGPVIRVREGDILEVTHTNNDPSGMLHNIDFHAVTGPGGGAPLLTVEKGETKTATFKILRPGLFIYHCAVEPIGVHISNGMYGAIIVDPVESLPKVDREYIIYQSEIYGEPPKDGGHVLEFSYENALAAQPNYVVFNGRVGSMGEATPITGKTGETIRLWVSNIGPNLFSAFHVIGAVFDRVYKDGDIVTPPTRSTQVVTIPPGGSAIVDLQVPVPGTYTLIDHSIFRVDKGAVGFLSVSGEPRPDLYYAPHSPRNCPGCKTHTKQ